MVTSMRNEINFMTPKMNNPSNGVFGDGRLFTPTIVFGAKISLTYPTSEGPSDQSVHEKTFVRPFLSFVLSRTMTGLQIDSGGPRVPSCALRPSRRSDDLGGISVSLDGFYC